MTTPHAADRRQRLLEPAALLATTKLRIARFVRASPARRAARRSLPAARPLLPVLDSLPSLRRPGNGSFVR